MHDFPPGSPNFQLPRPLKGVVYADESGSVYVMHSGQVALIWTPPKPVQVNQKDEE